MIEHTSICCSTALPNRLTGAHAALVVHFALLEPCGAVLLLHLDMLMVCAAHWNWSHAVRMQPFVPVVGMAGA
jgi:hypothetical protein